MFPYFLIPKWCHFHFSFSLCGVWLFLWVIHTADMDLFLVWDMYSYPSNWFFTSNRKFLLKESNLHQGSAETRNLAIGPTIFCYWKLHPQALGGVSFSKMMSFILNWNTNFSRIHLFLETFVFQLRINDIIFENDVIYS